MLRPGQGLMIIVITLLAFGVVMVTSAGLAVDAPAPLSMIGILLSKPALFALLAVVALWLGTRVPVMSLYQRRGLAGPVPWILLGSLMLLVLVHVPGIGHEVNGARRWIRLGSFGFQPSELVKWGVPIVLAWHATRRVGAMQRLGAGFLAPMIPVGLLCALIATEDLGTAVLIGMTSLAILLAAGARVWHALTLVPLAVAGFTAAVISNPYRLDRLRAFLDPYQDPQGIGYHVLQSMSAVSSGGVAGRGLGHGLHKFGYLPEDTTDFVFAIISEELGLAGATAVVFLYAALLFLGVVILLRATHPFPRLLTLGILVTIGGQAIINLFVVTGLAPTKGIALPLLSAGGTGWCLTAFAIGLIVSVERTATEPLPDPPLRGVLAVS